MAAYRACQTEDFSGDAALDKRRAWAAAASAQIVNQCLDQDAPRHLIYAEVEKIILAAHGGSGDA
jgi:hypothetical protein